MYWPANTLKKFVSYEQKSLNVLRNHVKNNIDRTKELEKVNTQALYVLRIWYKLKTANSFEYLFAYVNSQIRNKFWLH